MRCKCGNIIKKSSNKYADMCEECNYWVDESLKEMLDEDEEGQGDKL